MTIDPQPSNEDTYCGRRGRFAGLCTAVLACMLCASSPALFGQAAEKALRVGILSSGTLENREAFDKALIDGLREQGYVEGRNLVIERRYGSGRIRDNATELARMKLDAILTTCTPSTRAMKEATSSTPIVMAAVSDPVRQGIIASLAKPGRNVTGTSSQAEDLLGKRLELLAEIVPRPATVAVLTNANNPVHVLGWETLAAAAKAINLPLLKVELRKVDDLPPAFEAAVRARAGALFVMPDDPMMLNLRPQIVDLASRHRMPDFYWASDFVERGGLLSYGEDLRTSYRATAAYMGKIKRGANPADLPVEQPTRFELVINQARARALGLNIPRSMLLRADRLIQ